MVVSTPSKVALAAVDKLLRVLKELKLPVVGVVENMKLNDSTLIEDYSKEKDFKYLGSISLDETLEEAIADPDKLIKTGFMKDFEKIVEKTI